MKKLIILLFIVLIALSIVSCKEKEVRDAPMEQLSFKVESNPNYIGSYTISRIYKGQEWVEWDEWTPVQALIGREVVCFGYFGGYGTFRARSDYEWIQVEYDSRNTKCLELVKRK